MSGSDGFEAITREHVDASQLRLRSLWKRWSPRYLARVSTEVQTVRKYQESVRHVYWRCSAIYKICQDCGLSCAQPLTISIIVFNRSVKLAVTDDDTGRAALSPAGRQAATTWLCNFRTHDQR